MKPLWTLMARDAHKSCNARDLFQLELLLFSHANEMLNELATRHYVICSPFALHCSAHQPLHYAPLLVAHFGPSGALKLVPVDSGLVEKSGLREMILGLLPSLLAAGGLVHLSPQPQVEGVLWELGIS